MREVFWHRLEAWRAAHPLSSDLVDILLLMEVGGNGFPGWNCAAVFPH